MLRKHSVIKFALLTIIAILGILLCVCPFAVPYSSTNYNGFVGAIKKGVELNGGVFAVYECKLPEGSDKELSQAIDDSLSKIEIMFQREGYTELFVTRQGGNKVSIVASGARDTDSCFDFIENRQEMSFTLSQYSDSLTNPEVYLTSSSIAKVRPKYDYVDSNAVLGLSIEFTSEGKSEVEALKKRAEESGNETVYIYLGEIGSSPFATIDYEDLNGNSIFITPSSLTESNAIEVAYQVVSGSLDVEMTLKERGTVSAVFGKNTMLYIGICLLIVIVATMAFMWLRYGHLGLLGMLSLAFYLIIFTMLMVAIPFIVFNLSAIVGSLIAFAFVVFANCFVFEKIREEYAIGKKIHLSCKGGFKKSLWPLIDSHVLIVLVSIFIWIFAPASLKVFAITLIVGAVVSLFSVLVLTRYFVNIYLPLNSSKPKKLHLYRDKNVREFKEEEVTIIPEGAEFNEATGGNNE